MKRNRLLTFMVLMVITTSAFAQGARNIRFSEVMTINTMSIQDEYGRHPSWVELVNASYSTYDIRNMYVSTDRTVLNKKMSVKERTRRMSMIPNNTAVTQLAAHQHIILFLNSNPTCGSNHLSARIDTAKSVWIALYDANATELIDSITTPKLYANASYARCGKASTAWQIKKPEEVTPGTANGIQVTESKIDKLKKDDPHGIGISILCMGIVFLCLALLYVFFLIFGWIADRRNRLAATQPIKPVVQTAKKIEKVRQVTTNILQDGFETRGRNKEIYIAVISMALKQYADDVHDVESGIISIKPHNSEWGAHNQFTNHNI